MDEVTLPTDARFVLFVLCLLKATHGEMATASPGWLKTITGLTSLELNAVFKRLVESGVLCDVVCLGDRHDENALFTYDLNLTRILPN